MQKVTCHDATAVNNALTSSILNVLTSQAGIVLTTSYTDGWLLV